MITLDIFSDPVCPWCMIGKAYLDRALEQIGDHPFTIRWHPFQLTPEVPPEGLDRRDFLEAKFGSQMDAAKSALIVLEAAEKAGLEIHFEKMLRQPNTLDAHRVIHWAGLEGKQNAIVDRLFKAYFREGLDIGQRDVLADLAGDVGMDRDMTARLLASDADADDLLARDEDARDKGVRAVPTFLVDRRYIVSGAQPPEFWVQVAEEIKELAAQAPAPDLH